MVFIIIRLILHACNHTRMCASVQIRITRTERGICIVTCRELDELVIHSYAYSLLFFSSTARGSCDRACVITDTNRGDISIVDFIKIRLSTDANNVRSQDTKFVKRQANVKQRTKVPLIFFLCSFPLPCTYVPTYDTHELRKPSINWKERDCRRETDDGINLTQLTWT